MANVYENIIEEFNKRPQSKIVKLWPSSKI